MNTSQGALYFGAGIDMNEWRKNITEMRKDILGLTNETKRETQQMDDAFKKLSVSIGAYFSVNALYGFTRQLVQVRGEFQKTEIAFGTMLKSKEKAKELMGQMVDLAAKTPFGLQEVSDGAKRLLAFQIPANEVVDTLRRMGDVAAGLGVPMGQLIHVYGQVKAQGKLMTNDLYQFMNAGIPILAELGKVLGKSEAEIKSMVGEGKIGFTEIQQVIQNMTNEGGLFFNLMEQQSASLSGKIANLQDNFEQMLNKIGESQEGLLSGSIDALSFLVENYEKIGVVLTGLVATYGAYRTAVITQIALSKSLSSSLVFDTATRHLNVTATLKQVIAQAKLNAVMMANPYAFAIAGVVGLIAVLYNLNDGLEGAEKGMKNFQDRITEQKKEADEYKNIAKELIGIIKQETSSYSEKAEALRKLKEQYPEIFVNMSLQEAKTLDLIEAEKKLNEVIEDRQRKSDVEHLAQLKNELNVLLTTNSGDDHLGVTSRRIEEIRTQISQLEFAEKQRQEGLMQQNATLEEQLAYWDKEEKAIVNAVNKLKDANPELQKMNIEAGKLPDHFARMQSGIDGLNFENVISRLKYIRTEAMNITNALKGNGKDEKTPEKKDSELNKNEIDEKLKLLREEKAGIANANVVRLKEINKEIAKYQQLAKKYDDPTISNPKKPTKSQINAPIKGSLGALEKELSDLNTRLNNKISIADKKVREQLLKRREELEKKIAEIRKSYIKKSFDEEIEETKRQIAVRDKLLQAGYSEDTVNTMFPKVKDKSYIHYLEEQEIALKKIMEAGKGSEETAQNLLNIQDKIKEYKGHKNFIDGLNESIEKLKKQYSGDELIDKLEKLNRLDVNQTEEETRQKDNIIREAIVAEKNRMKEKYDYFLQEHRTFKEKSAEIEKEYNELLKQADNDLKDGNITKEVHADIVFKINKEKSDKITDEFLKDLQNSDVWFNAFKDVERGVVDGLMNLREKLVEQLKLAKTEAEKHKIKIQIDEIDKKINSSGGITKHFERFKQSVGGYIQSKKAVKEAQEEYNEAVRQFGEASDQAKTKHKELSDAEQNAFNKKQEMLDKMAKLSEKANKYIGASKSIVDDLKGAFDDLGLSLDNDFGDALEKIEGVLGGLEQMSEGLATMAKGDPVSIIAGGIKTIGGIVKTVGSLFNNDRKKERAIQREKKALDGLKTAYEDLAHAANKAFGSRKYSSQTGLIQNLEQQKVRLENMIRGEQSKKKKDHGKIEDWRGQISAINRSIDDIKTSVIKDVLQTDVIDAAAKVGDALVDAFGRGEGAAKSMEQVANDLVKNMLKNQLNLKLQERMKPILDNMLNAMGFNQNGNGVFSGLDKDKIEEFKRQIQNAGAGMQSFLEQYKEIFSTSEGLNDSLKGSIKGMSEQTADVLAGQFNAIRINTGEILKNQGFGLELMRSSVGNLIRIEENTRPLKGIYKEISELNAKVKSSGSGLRASGID